MEPSVRVIGITRWVAYPSRISRHLAHHFKGEVIMIENSVAKCPHGSYSECSLCGETKEPEGKMCHGCSGTGRILRRVSKRESAYVQCPVCNGTGFSEMRDVQRRRMVKMIKMFRSQMTEREYENKIYELARKEGDRRFGSECKHERAENGRCVNCLRRVI